MTPQMHTELATLIDRFYSEEITDEEWVLLQVHMAYCAACEGEFFRRQRARNTDRLGGIAQDTQNAAASLD